MLSLQVTASTLARSNKTGHEVRKHSLKVMRSSEGIDPDDDLFEPEYVSVGYGDEAFYDAMGNVDDASEEDDE